MRWKLPCDGDRDTELARGAAKARRDLDIVGIQQPARDPAPAQPLVRSRHVCRPLQQQTQRRSIDGLEPNLRRHGAPQGRARPGPSARRQSSSLTADAATSRPRAASLSDSDSEPTAAE